MEIREIDLGTLALPDAASDGTGHPGVVLVHDVWGLGDHFRELARRFADAGFATLALDLYRGRKDTKIVDPGRWMRELSDPEVLDDIAIAVDYLASSTYTAAPRGHHGVSVVGFCMGGMYALMAGCALEGVAAVVPFYGLLSHDHGLLYAAEGLDAAKKPRSPIEMAAELRCPLLGFFGDADPYVPAADIEQLRAQLTASGQTGTEVVVFEGAGHAFMNDTRADAYHPEYARQAWARMLDFLKAQAS